MLAGGWAVWFIVGLMLSIWQRRERTRLVVHGPATRHRSGVLPAFQRQDAIRSSAAAPGEDRARRHLAAMRSAELEALLSGTRTRRARIEPRGDRNDAVPRAAESALANLSDASSLSTIADPRA